MIKKKKLNTSQLVKLANSLGYIKTHFVGLAMNKRFNAIKHLADKEDLINMTWKKCVILFLLIKNQPEQILSTLVLAQKNKWMSFLDKLSISSQNIQNTLHIQLFQILIQELISNEKDYKLYWTPAYKELSEKLSLPTEIDFPGLALNLLNVSSQKPVVPLQCLTMTNTKAQNKNLQKTYYQLPTSTVVDKWENKVTNQTPLKNLKIQLKPSIYQQKILNEWIKTSNYVYNKTIACINNGNKVNFINLRDKCVTSRTKKLNNDYCMLAKNIRVLNKQIKEEKNEEQLKILNEQLIIETNKRKAIKFEKNIFIQEWESNTPKAIRDGAVGDVCKANDTGWSNLKAGNINHFKLGFRKITKNTSFVLPHSLIKNKSGTLVIAPTFLKDKSTFKMGKRTLKKYKDIEINNDCRIIYERNKYWIAIPIRTILKQKVKCLNYCGIDPGVRTFLTSFGNNSVVEYTQNKVLLKKLNKKIDLLNSQRTKKRNKYKIERRKENVINEIHWKSINDILKRNDYVFYGDIKSHDIVKKSKNKFLNRDINDLKFYKFKERLMYKANVLNKRVFSVNEMYTTKTCSSCGYLNNVGKKEIYKCEMIKCNKTLLRDVSAAKNILMKGIIKFL